MIGCVSDIFSFCIIKRYSGDIGLLALKAPSIICSRQPFQILLHFQNNKKLRDRIS